MQVFVTGSTGLLGYNLVHLLIDQGYEVKVLARSRQKAETLFTGLPVTIVTGDMQNVEGFAAQLEGCDILFHAAASFRDYYQPGDHWKMLEQVNIKGTIELLAEAEKQGIKKVIYVSSSGVIGRKPDHAPGDESTSHDAEQLKNLYFKSKVLAEEAIATFLRTHTLPVVLILPTAMFGPGDSGPTSTGRLVQDFLARKIPGIIDGGLSTVDARDVAQAMLAAVDKGKSGERYIVGGNYISMPDILKSLERTSGVPAPRLHIPYALILAYAAGAEFLGRITGQSVLVSRESIHVLHLKHTVVSNKAVRELGATFRPLRRPCVTRLHGIVTIAISLPENYKEKKL